jgi:hypothetical protein
MKRLFTFLAVAVLALVAACTTAPGASPAQNAVNVTATSCKNIDAAIVAADQAVVSGVLKGQDARNALKGLTAAQAGCVTALASIQAANAAASAASGVSK